MDILVTFVGRRISFGKCVIRNKLLDCRMEHVVSSGSKKRTPFRYDFDYKLVNLEGGGKSRNYDLVNGVLVQGGFALRFGHAQCAVDV